MNTGRFAGILTTAGICIVLPGCFLESDADKWKRVEQMQKDYEEGKKLREKMEANQEEGRRALEAADNAIRNDIDDRRSRLERAAKSHRIDASSPGVRVDTYVLKSGRVVYCRTIVHSAGPIMNCDGDV